MTEPRSAATHKGTPFSEVPNASVACKRDRTMTGRMFRLESNGDMSREDAWFVAKGEEVVLSENTQFSVLEADEAGDATVASFVALEDVTITGPVVWREMPRQNVLRDLDQEASADIPVLDLYSATFLLFVSTWFLAVLTAFLSDGDPAGAFAGGAYSALIVSVLGFFLLRRFHSEGSSTARSKLTNRYIDSLRVETPDNLRDTVIGKAV